MLATDPATAPRLLEQTATGRRRYVHAVAIYLAVRAVSVTMLAVLADHNGQTLMDRLTAWDGWWYTNLAEHGYAMTDTLDAAGQPYTDAPMAFFPLYPAFVGIVERLPGLDFATAAVLFNVGAGAAVACALLRIGERVTDRPRAGLVLVALFAGAPMAITLSMAYTEALFVALAAWALVGVLERNWLLAGVCCAFAGLTRSTALVLIVVVVAAAAAAVAVRHGRDRWPAVVCVVVAPLGLAGYWAAVYRRTGGSWQAIELRGWNTRFDWGAESAQYILDMLTRDGSVMQTLTVLLLLGALVLAGVCVASRIPWPLAGFGIGVLLLVVGTAGLPAAKVRFLLPSLAVLLVPVAVGLAARRPATIVATLAGVTLAGSWFSAHSLTAWHYAM